MNSVTKWTMKHMFTFSLDKTVCIHFAKKKGALSSLTLKMEQNPSKVINEAKFHEILFDSKLSWMPHLKLLHNLFFRSNNLLRCLSYISWGADSDTFQSILRLN